MPAKSSLPSLDDLLRDFALHNPECLHEQPDPDWLSRWFSASDETAEGQSQRRDVRRAVQTRYPMTPARYHRLAESIQVLQKWITQEGNLSMEKVALVVRQAFMQSRALDDPTAPLYPATAADGPAGAVAALDELRRFYLARATDPPSNPAKGQARSKSTKGEANLKARDYLRKNPKATVRELSAGIGCATGSVSNLPAWRAVKEQRDKGRQPKKAGVVSLTPRMQAIVGTDDADQLARLTREQAADAEPSPLEDDPNSRQGTPRQAKTYRKR